MTVARLDRDVQVPRLPAVQGRRPPRDSTVQRVGRGRQPDGRRQPGFVVAEPDAVAGRRDLDGNMRARRGVQSTDREDVGEVGVDIEADGHLAWRLGPPAQDDLVLQPACADAPPPFDLEGRIAVPGSGGDEAAKACCRRGQLRRSERPQRCAVNPHDHTRQVPCVIGDESVGVPADVAQHIRNRERQPVDERDRRVAAGEDHRLFGNRLVIRVRH